jgi:hypothetical protein
MMIFLLGLVAFSLNTPVRSLAKNSSIDTESAPKNSPIDEMTVEFFIKLSETCSLFDPEVENPFFYNISASFSEPLENSSRISLHLSTGSVAFNATATYLNEIQKTIRPILVPLGYGSDVVLIFDFEDGLTSLEIKVWGSVKGLSLLWRNLVDIQLFTPTFSHVIPTSYKIQVEVPNTLEVSSITSPYIQTLKPREAMGENSRIYTLPIPVSISVYYRPSYWLSLAIAMFFIIVCSAALSLYLIGKMPPSLVTIVSRKIGDMMNIMRSRLNAQRLFTLYMLCSILMVSLSLVTGPDPRIKIYAVATPYQASILEKDLTDIMGPVQVIAPQDTVGEFESMANLGIIKAVFISYYPKPILDRVVQYTLEAMNRVGLIVVDEYAADPQLTNNLRLRFGEKVFFVQGFDKASLVKISGILRRLKAENPFGLELQIGLFKAAAATIAILSILMVFFGLSFLSSRLIDAGRSKGFGALPEAIMLPVFIFYFTQAVYMASSVLLAMPIGLHAVSSGSMEITAVGLLGFGGGSKPRAISGILGFLIGALIATKSKSELDRWGLFLFIVLTVLLIIDPFAGGEIFYDALLYFFSSPRSDIMRTSIFYVKNIFGSMGMLFGGWITDIYGVSTGEILFYASALPMFLFPILKRSTSTLLLLICCLAAGSGFIRTAEMTPYKTVASLIPGLATGIAIAAIFTAVSLVETFIRRRL